MKPCTMTLKDLERGGNSFTSHQTSIHYPSRTISFKVSIELKEIELKEIELKELTTPCIISFDDDDPDLAINWSGKRKWSIVSVLGMMTFITSLASSMVTPAIKQVLQDFHVDSENLGSLFVSIYILGFAAGPLVIAPLSEFYGRAVLYHCTNTLTLIFTIACALAPNISALLVFRLFAGITGSAVNTLGAGTIADLFVQQERGTAMSIWSALALLGPIIGPAAGGFLGEALGWRWIIWVIAIMILIGTVSNYFVMRETYAPVLLRRRTEFLREKLGDPALTSALDNGLSPLQLFKQAIVRPLKMFISPIMVLASLFIAIDYGLQYLLLTTMPRVYGTQYGFSEGIVGLTYLSIGTGMIIGVIIFGFTSDRYLKKKAEANGGACCLEDRLVPMLGGAFLIPASFFIYGWAAERHRHWIIPILATGLLGVGINVTFMALQTYLVDIYTLYAASAMAASTLLRSLGGAFLPLLGPPMYDALGLGWGNTLLGTLALIVAPIPIVFVKYGKDLRKIGSFKVNT